MSSWQIADVNEVPPVKEDWPTTWKSVRHHFGISGFGVNAVTKDAGNVLIPEHDETASGQQELYFVHAGEVKATLDSEVLALPAGSLVHCEPGAKRKFEASASPTTLLVIGGTPGKPYEVGPWER
jgi:quercetin dioxygenase-like cupin family protein